MRAVLWDKAPNLCGVYANFALLVSYLNWILGHPIGVWESKTWLVCETSHIWCQKKKKKTSQGWTRQWPQECQETQGLNEPIGGDTKNAFRRVIPFNERINASLWHAAEIMGREEMRAESVTRDPNGGLASPAQRTGAPTQTFLTGTYEGATILFEGNSLKKNQAMFSKSYIYQVVRLKFKTKSVWL